MTHKCSNLAEVTWPLWDMMYVMCTELLHCTKKPVGKVWTEFFLLGGWGSPPPPTKNLLICPLPTTFLFPPTEGQFNLIKTFLAVVIVPVPFLF